MNPLSPAGQPWRDRIKVHPAVDTFPMMAGDQLIALGKDIAAALAMLGETA